MKVQRLAVALVVAFSVGATPRVTMHDASGAVASHRQDPKKPPKPAKKPAKPTGDPILKRRKPPPKPPPHAGLGVDRGVENGA